MQHQRLVHGVDWLLFMSAIVPLFAKLGIQIEVFVFVYIYSRPPPPSPTRVTFLIHFLIHILFIPVFSRVLCFDSALLLDCSLSPLYC